jgi:hypothetical protein
VALTALQTVSFTGRKRAVVVRVTSVRYSACLFGGQDDQKRLSLLWKLPCRKIALLTAAEPSEQDIAVRAHELFLKRGAVRGHELEDWLEAERELRNKE